MCIKYLGCQTSWSIKALRVETEGVLLIDDGLWEGHSVAQRVGTTPHGHLQAGWTLSVLLSPQGLVNREFLAHLASRVLWVPKVSQVPRMVPKFAMSWIDNRGPVLGSQTALTLCPRPVQGRWAHRGSPTKESGVRVGASLGCMADLGTYFHLFPMAPFCGL